MFSAEWRALRENNNNKQTLTGEGTEKNLYLSVCMGMALVSVYRCLYLHAWAKELRSLNKLQNMPPAATPFVCISHTGSSGGDLEAFHSNLLTFFNNASLKQWKNKNKTFKERIFLHQTDWLTNVYTLVRPRDQRIVRLDYFIMNWIMALQSAQGKRVFQANLHGGSTKILFI